MIGVDIIDHSFSFKNSKYSLEQYKTRILNKSEFVYCSCWNELDLLWAIKESAYKNHFKKTGAYFINPKRILIVNIDLTNQKFIVEIDDNYYSGSFVDCAEYVYAVCGEEEDVKVYLQKINDPGQPDEQPAPYLNDSVISYHQEGFPLFIQQGGSKYAYSRSHHGKYYISVMCAFSHN